MLGTIPGLKSEFPFSYNFEDRNRMLDAIKGLLPAPATPPAPLVAGAARRSHIHHSNTTQTRHSEPREESLFAFDFCRTLSTHGRRIRRNING